MFKKEKDILEAIVSDRRRTVKKYLDVLKPVFQSYPEIKLAYLFGSRAGQACGPTSDYDFAVYFGDTKAGRMFSIKLDLITQISHILKSDRVDIVILNLTKSPELKYAVVKEGILIFEREPFKVMVEPKILNEYFDFHMMLSKHGLTKAIA
jgi:predicted nucleotidyltransferase